MTRYIPMIPDEWLRRFGGPSGPVMYMQAPAFHWWHWNLSRGFFYGCVN